MNKVVAWIVLLLGIYQVLALLVTAVPTVLDGVWGWVVAVVLVVLGGYLLKKPAAA